MMVRNLLKIVKSMFKSELTIRGAIQLLESYCKEKRILIEFDNKGMWVRYEGVYIRYLEKYNSVSKIIFNDGKFETQEIKMMNKNLANSSVLFDIGCNVGIYSMAAISKCPGIQVHSFEASCDTFEDLKDNISKNGFANSIVMNNVAVGECLKNVFITSNYHSSNFVIEKDVNMNKTSVHMITIDNYVKENNINKIDFVKIDVEGSEQNALLGSLESLKRFKPIVLVEMIEKNTASNDFIARNVQDYKETIELLCSIGYKYYVLDDTDKFISMDQLKTGIFKNSFHNYVFYSGNINI